jgi:nitrate reductase alpha subunit
LAEDGPPAEAVGLQPFTLTVPPRRTEGGLLMGGSSGMRSVTLAVVVVGTWWRYRYDKFGWTTRSSQLYESRLLRIASPMFHFGILVVIVGHVIGCGDPGVVDACARYEQRLPPSGGVLGTIAGLSTLGIALLIYRRRTTGPVFLATTVNDKVMYVVLVAAIVGRIVRHRAGFRDHRRGLQLPRDHLGVVPVDLGVAAARDLMAGRRSTST